jgi:hypothetical protein
LPLRDKTFFRLGVTPCYALRQLFISECSKRNPTCYLPRKCSFFPVVLVVILGKMLPLCQHVEDYPAACRDFLRIPAQIIGGKNSRKKQVFIWPMLHQKSLRSEGVQASRPLGRPRPVYLCLVVPRCPHPMWLGRLDHAVV